MADRNTTWDRERNNERDDWQREEAWRRERESGGSGERYREREFDRPDYGRRGQSLPRGDYGPDAFNPGGGATVISAGAVTVTPNASIPYSRM